MSTKTALPRILLVALMLAALYGGQAPLRAQEKPDAKPTAAKSESNEQEIRGEGLFLQRCSLCHLPRKLKYGSPPTVGPSLSGVLKEATPEKEKFVRQFILKGTANMPGFQYGLEPKELDELILYLKTL